MLIFRLSVASAVFAFVACLALLSNDHCAHAQESYAFPPTPPVRGRIAAEGRVWTIGNPELVAAADVSNVLPAPDFKHLLITRRTRTVTADPAEQMTAYDSRDAPNALPGEITVSWLNVKTRRVRVLWRCPVAGGERVGVWSPHWVGKTGAAVMRLADGRGVHLLFVNPATGTTSVMDLPAKSYDFPQVSPTVPFIGLAGADGACEGEMQFINGDGKLGDPIPLPSNIFFTRWSDDGSTLRGVGSGKNAVGESYGQWYVVNPATRTVTRIPEPPKNAQGEADYDNYPDPAQGLPICLTRGKSSLKLVIEAVKNAKDTVTIATDGEPAFLLPDGSGAFFRQHGALFFVPIVPVPPTVDVAKPTR